MFSHCKCVTRYRVYAACDEGFSCSNLSCRAKKNQVVKITPSKAPYCFPCQQRKEAEIRARFYFEDQEKYQESLKAKWSKKYYEQVKKEMKRAEKEEIAKLKAVCKSD